MSHAESQTSGSFSLPPLNYDFIAPQKIVFGWGRRSEIGTLAASLGRRAFLVVGSRTLENNGTVLQLVESLKAAGIEPAPMLWRWPQEPQVHDVDLFAGILTRAPLADGDFVIGLGGGSAIDLAKATAAMATNRESKTVADYLEGVGRGLKIANPPLPMLAIPTTAGTGSEATKNAVISSDTTYHVHPGETSRRPIPQAERSQPFKKSLRSEQMVPRIVLVDPELTVTTPATVTAYSGMDAITQLIESYISRRAKPIPRALCLQGLQLAISALPEAVRDGTCRWAREAMAQAALLSGMALANSGLGVAHGVAAALGAECGVAHGLACAVMLPAAIEANRAVCQAELATLGRAVLPNPIGSDEAAADAFIQRIKSVAGEIQIPTRLRDLGVLREQIPALVSGSHGNSLSGNPRDIGDQELADILEKLW